MVLDRLWHFWDFVWDIPTDSIVFHVMMIQQTIPGLFTWHCQGPKKTNRSKTFQVPGLKLKYPSLPPHSVGQNKSQGQPRLMGLRNTFYISMGGNAKSTAKSAEKGEWVIVAISTIYCNGHNLTYRVLDLYTQNIVILSGTNCFQYYTTSVGFSLQFCASPSMWHYASVYLSAE